MFSQAVSFLLPREGLCIQGSLHPGSESRREVCIRGGLHPGVLGRPPWILWDMVNERAVSILLECILAQLFFSHRHMIKIHIKFNNNSEHFWRGFAVFLNQRVN